MGMILLLDSDKDFGCLVEDILSGLGHEVIGVPHSSKAVRSVRDMRPDLVIIDNLVCTARPVCNTLTTIKKDPRTAKIPVMACTPLNSREIEAHSKELVPLLSGVLFKPFEVEALEGMVTHILDGAGTVC
jgi:CheY-like chemotaxis protein